MFFLPKNRLIVSYCKYSAREINEHKFAGGGIQYSGTINIMRIKTGGLSDEKYADINVLPFGYTDEIDYKKELDGESGALVGLGHISKKNGGITLVGVPTDNHGLKRLSVIMFENGKLISIFDLNDGTKYSPSFGVGSFGLGGVKCGVLVGGDLFDCDNVKALSVCGCALIIDLYPDLLNENVINATNFYAYSFGIDCICICRDKVIASLAGGKKIQPSAITDGAIFDMPCKRIYRDAKIKKAGCR